MRDRVPNDSPALPAPQEAVARSELTDGAATGEAELFAALNHGLVNSYFG